jgi:hypothetical protein
MNRTDLATCHCIISHPHEPKFLAVRHADGWSPPMLRFAAAGSVGYKAGIISEGINSKYGLRATLLRHLAAGANYHCIELEVHSGGSKNLEAIWMDREAYSRARRTAPGEADPFDDWLMEKESGRIPGKRPPWEREGWFREAGDWIHFQLDRMGMQTTGSVEQFRAANSSSCILRIPTSVGRVYFKASYAKPPGEAAVMAPLLEQWPDHVVRPLMAETGRNWILHQDFDAQGMRPLDPAEYPGMASVMAGLQIESSETLDEWKNRGCPDQGLDYLSGFLGDSGPYEAVLSATQSGLDGPDLERFRKAGEQLGARCDQLAGYSIPNTLVHQDFRAGNFYRQNDRLLISDWSDLVISHPFFCLSKMIASAQNQAAEQEGLRGGMQIDEELLKEITGAYLEAFIRFEPIERLREALRCVVGLQTAWEFSQWVQELNFLEPGAREYLEAGSKIQALARQMIDEAGA